MSHDEKRKQEKKKERESICSIFYFLFFAKESIYSIYLAQVQYV